MRIARNRPMSPARRRYPLDVMAIGDSIFTKRNLVSARVAAWSYGKRTGKKFATRRERDGVRIWRIA